MTEQNKQKEFEDKLESLMTKVRRQGMAVGQITIASSIIGMLDARKESKIPPSKFLSDLKLDLESTVKRLSESLNKMNTESDDNKNDDDSENNIQSGEN